MAEGTLGCRRGAAPVNGPLWIRPREERDLNAARPLASDALRLVERADWLKTERSQQSSAPERHRMKGIPLASCGRSNCFRSFPHHQIQTFLGAFLLIYSPFYAAQTSFKPCSPQTGLHFCPAGLCSFPSSVCVCVCECLYMQTQRSCQPGCTRIFCVVSAALDFRLMKSEARSAPVVGAPPRRACRLTLGSHQHVCNVQL